MMENLQSHESPTTKRHICYGSYFKFKDKIYEQTSGVPIGSLLAGILAEIILRKVENQRIQEFQPELKFYLRFVDDIMVTWKDDTKLQKFTKAFTLDSYGLLLRNKQLSQQNIHYLVIKIITDNERLKTSVYRKSLYESVLIPNWSQDSVT